MNVKHKCGILLFLLLSTISLTQAAGNSPPASKPVTSRAYVLDTVLWPYNATTKSYNIPVCWEFSSTLLSSAAERQLVTDALKATWERYSLVKYVLPSVTGTCPFLLPPTGIRIVVNNLEPPQAALGKEGDAKIGVMQLNFKLNTPFTSTIDLQTKTIFARCQKDNPNITLATCLQSTAIHEFVHVLGLAHEQNRPDDPPVILGSCHLNDNDPRILPQGSFSTKGNTLFTDYDPHSMMNYCRSSYFDRIDLSPLDKLATRVYYGQMPSYDSRTRILSIPRIQRYDGAILTGSFNLISAGFQQSASLKATTTPSTSPATLYANGVLYIPELKYINPAGHVNQILRATLQPISPGLYKNSWIRLQPTQFSPVHY